MELMNQSNDIYNYNYGENMNKTVEVFGKNLLILFIISIITICGGVRLFQQKMYG